MQFVPVAESTKQDWFQLLQKRSTRSTNGMPSMRFADEPTQLAATASCSWATDASQPASQTKAVSVAFSKLPTYPDVMSDAASSAQSTVWYSAASHADVRFRLDREPLLNMEKPAKEVPAVDDRPDEEVLVSDEAARPATP